MARGRYPARLKIKPPAAEVAGRYYLSWDGREVHTERHRFPPLTSQCIFENDHPLEIDFGCGTGMLAIQRAQENPGVNILGIDKAFKPLWYAVDQAHHNALNNIKFLRADFGVLLPLLQPASLHAAYYFFPTPPDDYTNERANRRRHRFFRSMYTALVSGGRLYFMTDSAPFYSCIMNIIKGDSVFSTLHAGSGCEELVTGYRRMWECEGREFRSIVVEKV